MNKGKSKKENTNKNLDKKANYNLYNYNYDQSMLKEVFLAIFVVISMVMGLTLYFYYKVNSNYQEEIGLMKDVHHLKANFNKFENNIYNSYKGYIEISEVFEGVNIIGKVEGLKPGSTHAVHILEFSDLSLLDKSKISKELLKHFNPMNRPHSCPTNKENENYHSGDFGNIIADNEGIAFISLTRKISLKSLNGRLVVVTNSADKCQEGIEYDTAEDILAFGLLNVVKPNIPSPVSMKNDYLMREINSVNKIEFDKKNNIRSVGLVGNEEKTIKNEKNKIKKVIQDKIVLPLPVKENKNIISSRILSNEDKPKINNSNTFLIKNNLDNESPFKNDNSINNYIATNSITKENIQPIKNISNDESFIFPKSEKVPIEPELENSNNGFTKDEVYGIENIKPSTDSNSNKWTNIYKDNKNFNVKSENKPSISFSENFNSKLKESSESYKEPKIALETNSNPFEHLNLNNPVSTGNTVTTVDNDKFFSSSDNSDFNIKESNQEILDNEKINQNLQKLLGDLEKEDKNLNSKTTSSISESDSYKTKMRPAEIPSISLAQLSSRETGKKINTNSMKKVINSDLKKPKTNYSFMSTNMEPYVNKLMNKTTSAEFFNKVDVNLLNPYRDYQIKKENKQNKINFNFDKIFKKKQNKKNENLRDMSIFNNVDLIQNIVKNETMKELKKKPLIRITGLPSSNYHKKNIFRTQPIIRKNEFGLDFPILNDFKSDVDFTNSNSNVDKNYDLNRNLNDFKKNFKLINFKQNDKQKEKEKSLFEIINKDFNHIEKDVILNPNKDKKRSESLNKMLENYSNQNEYVKKLESHHDKNKLFLNNLKDNIEMIDTYSNKNLK